MRRDMILPRLLEQLPRSVGTALREELSRAVNVALVRNNELTLTRFHRQLSLLVQSLPRDLAYDASATPLAVPIA
jgi:hypothetical protein